MTPEIIHAIAQREIGELRPGIGEITGLGCVNRVFKIETELKRYVLRMNDDPNRALEFGKEKWCLEQLVQLGIPAPETLAVGVESGFNFMLQEFIEGKAGVDCEPAEKENAWTRLGGYASKYHAIPTIDIPDAAYLTFHKNWHKQLGYNMELLEKSGDSLLSSNVFKPGEYQKLKEKLLLLTEKSFTFGLIHKDLCLRNVLVGADVFLIDWGMAEIGIVPHLEIGNMITSEEVAPEEIGWFLSGLGMDEVEYLKIESEINLINLLDRLDKYRWAEDHAGILIDEYIGKLRKAFERAF
ncbi:MAG TPA: aminoglycoside phosphotransferase family protein [Flavilitoribacter sp.]|nr:aminoglycoside phosphotransferase family protein [Flavilitoribacter sp.]